MLDTFFPEPRSSHKDHYVLPLGASNSSLLPSPWPHADHSPSVLCPGSRQRGSPRTRCVFFTRQAGARPLAIIENAQPGDMGIQLLPSSSQEHAVQKPQSHDSEHISTKKLWDDPLSPLSTGNLKLHSWLLLDISFSLCKLKSIQCNCALLSFTVLLIFHAVSAFHPILCQNRILPTFSSTLSAHYYVAAQSQNEYQENKK